MPNNPGRDQREPMERLVRMAAVLWAAARDGVDVDTLARVAGFTSPNQDSRREQVAKEVRHLNRQGWRVVNTAPAGERARYRMETVDNRLALRLSRSEAAALQRAALVADRADLLSRLGLSGSKPVSSPPVRVQDDPSDELDPVLEAVRHRCVVTFRYKGTPRLAHPQAVRRRGNIWYLWALEDGTEQPKWFAVSRMDEVEMQAPGTARRLDESPRWSFDPMAWQIDSPTDVVVATTPEYRDDVVSLLGRPIDEVEHEGELRMTVTTANWSAARARVYELGPRVTVLGSPEFRTSLLDELASWTGEAAL